MSSAGARHPIAGINARHTLAYGHNNSSAAIPKPERLIETTAHRGYCRKESIAADFVQHFADEIRPHSRFLQQILCRELRSSTLRSRGNQRCCGANQYAPCQQFGRGNFHHRDCSAACVLECLFHALNSRTGNEPISEEFSAFADKLTRYSDAFADFLCNLSRNMTTSLSRNSKL